MHLYGLVPLHWVFNILFNIIMDFLITEVESIDKTHDITMLRSFVSVFIHEIPYHTNVCIFSLP